MIRELDDWDIATAIFEDNRPFERVSLPACEVCDEPVFPGEEADPGPRDGARHIWHDALIIEGLAESPCLACSWECAEFALQSLDPGAEPFDHIRTPDEDRLLAGSYGPDRCCAHCQKAILP